MQDDLNLSESQQQPLLKVYHAESLEQALTEGQGGVNQSNSSRKVIKATITIPMPKADLAVVKFKLSNNRNAKAASIAEPETQQVSPDDDYDQEEPEMEFEDDSPRVKD
jgi:hypothetical protein